MEAVFVSIHLTLPTAWQQLTDEQLRFAYKLIAAHKTDAEVRTHCLLR